MISIRRRAVVYGEVWLDEEPTDTRVDILIHRHCRSPIRRVATVAVQSLRTDLTCPANEIVAAFDATCRNEIRRADRRDKLSYKMILEPLDGVDAFIAFYDKFATQKDIFPTDRRWLGRAAAARQLVLSYASRDSEQLVWHAHLRIGAIAILTHSASCFRGRDRTDRALVGRANRWLHWQDMLSFKQAGVRYYDWGGMFHDESTADRAGINQFKRMFGGRPVQAYEWIEPVSVRGRIWLAMRNVRRAWSPAPAV